MVLSSIVYEEVELLWYNKTILLPHPLLLVLLSGIILAHSYTVERRGSLV